LFHYSKHSSLRFPPRLPGRAADLEFARFLGIWIDLRRKNGTIQALYDHRFWDPMRRPKQLPWSLIRNVLHRVK
jgi:hypothetical protein